MNKGIERLIIKAEELGWSITEVCDGQYEFSKFSPAGQDFNFVVDSEDDPYLLLSNIYETYSNFDVSEETYLWLDDTGHGRNGAPYDMRDLYNDMEACECMILELHSELFNELY